MDPRKFLRMAALGLDDEILKTDWAWMCTMCQRCIYVCPMKIDIPQLIFYVRASWPREERPKGILGSCDMALRNDSCSAMGASPEDFTFVVEDVLEEAPVAGPEENGVMGDVLVVSAVGAEVQHEEGHGPLHLLETVLHPPSI